MNEPTETERLLADILRATNRETEPSHMSEEVKAEEETQVVQHHLSDTDEKQQVPTTEDPYTTSEAVKKELNTFQNEFPKGRQFTCKEAAKQHIQQFGSIHDITFVTLKSSAVMLRMGCKHFGNYRQAKAKDKLENAEKEIKRTKDGGIRKASKRCGVSSKIGCNVFIYLSIANKLPGKPWVVRGTNFEHNHPTTSYVLECAKINRANELQVRFTQLETITSKLNEQKRHELLVKLDNVIIEFATPSIARQLGHTM